MNTITPNANLDLNRYNPWWLDKTVLAEDPSKPKRDLFASLKDRILNRELITAVIGLRRVGKTTLIKQVINDLLLHGDIDRNRITYFSFEDSLPGSSTDLLVKIVEDKICQFPKNRLYFFLDEIQYVDRWNAILKKYFDLDPRLKFVVSGSSGLFIASSARESLAGRIQEMIVWPLSYGEYLRLNLQQTIKDTGLFNIKTPKDKHELLKTYFTDYLSYGEFPYLPVLPGWEEKKEYLVNFVIGKVVETDLPKLSKVRGVDEIKTLVDILFTNTGQTIQLQNLCSDLSVSQPTLRDYLALLESTYLFRQTYNLGVGYRQRSLRQRKIYPTSVNALAFKLTAGQSSDSFIANQGKLVETFVYNYLLRQTNDEVFFFRQREAKEVDFIIKTPNGLLPVEVKYQNQIRPEDLKSLIYYCQKQKLTKAVVVTKDKVGEEKLGSIAVTFVPAYLLI